MHGIATIGRVYLDEIDWHGHPDDLIDPCGIVAVDIITILRITPLHCLVALRKYYGFLHPVHVAGDRRKTTTLFDIVDEKPEFIMNVF